jgi:DNA-binding cell septation regulator SpoVG
MAKQQTKKLVTKVELVPIIPNKGHIAFANIVIENKLALNGVGIHTCLSRSGFRLLYPTKTLPNGKVIQMYYPINKQVADEIQDTIINEYEGLLENVARD